MRSTREIAASSVTNLAGRCKDRPILVMGNGSSRQGRKIDYSQFTTIGCNGVILDEAWPDFVLLNTPGMARAAWNRRRQHSGAEKSTLLLPEKGDFDFTLELPDTYTFRRTFQKTDHKRGVFSAGMLGNACVELAFLLEGNPIILAGFDGDSSQLFAGKMFYKKGHADPKFIRQCHTLLGQAIRKWLDEDPLHQIFQLYEHGGWKFRVWQP